MSLLPTVIAIETKPKNLCRKLLFFFIPPHFNKIYDTLNGAIKIVGLGWNCNSSFPHTERSFLKLYLKQCLLYRTPFLLPSCMYCINSTLYCPYGTLNRIWEIRFFFLYWFRYKNKIQDVPDPFYSLIILCLMSLSLNRTELSTCCMAGGQSISIPNWRIQEFYVFYHLICYSVTQSRLLWIVICLRSEQLDERIICSDYT